jgi:hypothetical protein
MGVRVVEAKRKVSTWIPQQFVEPVAMLRMAGVEDAVVEDVVVEDAMAVENATATLATKAAEDATATPAT